MIAEAVTNFVFSSGWRCRRGRVFDLLRADLPHAALTLTRSERTPAVSLSVFDLADLAVASQNLIRVD
jgi:hypothetical protein